MPIYAYKCESCGHRQDVLRKISDPPLTECPACHQATFVKQVTAAGFQLKGSGWYVTDFRGGNTGSNGNAAKAEGGGEKTEATKGAADGGSATKPADAPAAAPAPAPAPPASKGD